MLLGLNGATTMKANLETDIEVAFQAGYSYLEIWDAKLHVFLQQNSIIKLKEMLEKRDLKPLSINSLGPVTFHSKEKFDEMKQSCHLLCDQARILDCKYLCVEPSPLPSVDVTKEDVKRESIEKLQTLLKIAKQYDVALAFEFLGEPDCSVKDLSFCNDIIEEIDDPDMGLVLDVFHVYTGGSTLDSINQLDPKKIFIVHLNDAEDLPRESLKDEHRLLPGQGILPLCDILTRVRKIGYQGVYSIELFRPEYWEWDPSRLAIESRDSMIKILELN